MGEKVPSAMIATCSSANSTGFRRVINSDSERPVMVRATAASPRASVNRCLGALYTSWSRAGRPEAMNPASWQGTARPDGPSGNLRLREDTEGSAMTVVDLEPSSLFHPALAAAGLLDL